MRGESSGKLTIYNSLKINGIKYHQFKQIRMKTKENENGKSEGEEKSRIIKKCLQRLKMKLLCQFMLRVLLFNILKGRYQRGKIIE